MRNLQKQKQGVRYMSSSLNMNEKKHIDKLFCRGYLITANSDIDLSTNGFLNDWRYLSIGKFNFYIHNKQNIYFKNRKGATVFLIGNCINPFTKQYREDEILEDIVDNIENNFKSAINKINELTGSFLLGYIFNDTLEFLTDPTEMLFCTYGIINNNLYISSHYQLIGDLCSLEKDDYIKRLEKYKFFYKYGVFFPGDRTPFLSVKRSFTNHLYFYNDNDIHYERFFPTENIIDNHSEEEYYDTIKRIYNILQNTLICASQKWKKPAISLTGGVDSQTTLSASNGFRDKFFYYSYCSIKGDKIDCDAAHEIANHIGIPHTIFNISTEDKDFEDINTVRKIIEHNMGDYKCNKNDVRKRVFFSTNELFDVEIKSWVSEIGRANYYKKFGLKRMPSKLSPRNMTSMYKIFLTQRRLAKETDKIFEEFIKDSKFNELPQGYDASDMYLWEFRYSAWGGIVITSEHSYSNEIFIPFNNRILLNLMLSVPKSKRISDEFHHDIIKYGDPKLSSLGITITNWNETKTRQFFERLYFLFHSWIHKI